MRIRRHIFCSFLAVFPSPASTSGRLPHRPFRVCFTWTARCSPRVRRVHQSDLLHQRLRQFRHLHNCSNSVTADFFEPLLLCNQMLSKDSVSVACFIKRGRSMRPAIPRFSNLAASLGITGLFAIGYPADVRAQTIFCPTTLPLTNGSCTNGVDGAFSGAALASQALSEVSETTTQRPRRT